MVPQAKKRAIHAIIIKHKYKITIQHAPSAPTRHNLRNSMTEHVKEREREDEERSTSCIHERSPPPSVILAGQLEIAEHDRDLRRRDQHQHEDGQQEPEHHVHLVRHDGGHEEVDLEEDGSEGDAAAHEAGEAGTQIPRLGGDLPLDVVGADGHVVLGESVAEKRAEVDERKRHAEPEKNQLENGGCVREKERNPLRWMNCGEPTRNHMMFMTSVTPAMVAGSRTPTKMITEERFLPPK